MTDTHMSARQKIDPNGSPEDTSHQLPAPEKHEPKLLNRPIAELRTTEGQAISQIQAAASMQMTREREEVKATDKQPDVQVLQDGRFIGGNLYYSLLMRIDTAVSGIISADINSRRSPHYDYLASIRTAPGTLVQPSERTWLICAEDSQGNSANGTLSLDSLKPDGKTLVGSMTFDDQLNGLPTGTIIWFNLDFESGHMRPLGLERETEAGVDTDPHYHQDGVEHTIDSSLRAAGFDIYNVGFPTVIPPEPNGWGTTQLHTLMQDLAQAPLDRAAWELHLLILGKSTRNGLFGYMFDHEGILQRQGCAVFAEEIRRYTTDSHYPRKLIQTTVHEIGHALNLRHRFEREVGHADSTSHMNYDWRYRGGGRESEYWANYRFTFDPDELEFLRHGPRNAVIPGGAPFGSVRYWRNGTGGYVPYNHEVPISDLGLALKHPAAGPVFDFAQPVFLEVSLTNLGSQPITYWPEILDPKAGTLQIKITRRGGRSIDFKPVMTRCFDFSHMDSMPLNPGMTVSNNLNLTFGCAGFPFAEPGEYEVTAVLVFADNFQKLEYIVESQPLNIRVGYPLSRLEERDALVLYREDVGFYLAFGGSKAFGRAADDLEEIRERRQGRAKTVADPVVANIIRCAGIDSARPYRRFVKRKFKLERGSVEKAGKLLGMLSPQILNLAFDSHTAEHTAKLAQKFKERSNK